METGEEVPNAAAETKKQLLDEVARLIEEEQRDEALAKLLPFLDQNLDDPRPLFLAGYIFMKSDRPGLAVQMFKRATELGPNEPNVWHNLGKCYHECQRYEEAEMCFRRTLKLDPKHPNSLDGMAMINLNRGNYEEAIRYSDLAIATGAAPVDANVNKGMSNLALRRWREGWIGYNANLTTNKDRKVMVYGDEKPWDGTKGLVVACYGEQGIGDEISFGTCLPDLVRDSKKVIIECDGRLKHVFRRSFPTADVYGSRYTLGRKPWYDKYAGDEKIQARVAMGQLPQFYRNEDAAFPGTPYLIPNPEMTVQWRALFDSLGSGLKVGISWTGGRLHTGQKRRSVTLDTLLPILKQDAHFVSLQYSDPAEDLEAFGKKHPEIKIHHWPHGVQIYDFDVTIALISQLDLVISVTTTAIHAAGAVGKECWCLVPEKVMWRYMRDGNSFPWASSVTLFRQKGREWPVHTLSGMLKDKIQARNAKPR